LKKAWLLLVFFKYADLAVTSCSGSDPNINRRSTKLQDAFPNYKNKFR